MPATPWIALQAPLSDKQYLALVSYLPLRQYWALPKFFRFTLHIRTQLKQTPGLVGYSLDAALFRKRFWTLSVWETQRALDAFVHHAPHSDVMKALAPHMGKTQFAQWPVGAREIPLRWSSAKARIPTL